jgi:hypothetical protein
LVIHLVDYFRSSRSNHPGDQPVGDDQGWGLAGDPDQLWTLDELAAIKLDIERAGLKLEAIENFDPAHWHDVLLDGPQKTRQLENLKTIIRRAGQAGIPILGYNFSLAGVAGRVKGDFARGGAQSVGMDGAFDQPMPNGMVWNMVYDKTRTPRPASSLPPRRKISGGGCAIFWRPPSPSPRKRASPWPRIPTIRLRPPCARNPAWSISRASTRNCSTSGPARATPWNSASAAWPK